MTFAETPEQAQKMRDADDAYEKSWDKFEENKTSVRDALYGTFIVPENSWNQTEEDQESLDAKWTTSDGKSLLNSTWEQWNSEESRNTFDNQKKEKLSSEEVEKQEKLDDLKGSSSYPIIERLLEEGMIWEEMIEELSNGMNEDGSIDTDMLDVSEEAKELLSISIEAKENKKENLQKFQTDISGIPELQEMKTTYDLESWNDMLAHSLDTSLFEKIGGNYFSIEKKDGTTNTIEDVSMAIEVTSKDILKEFGNNIAQDTENFKEAMKNIASWNLANQLEGIESLYFLAQMGNAVSGAKMEKNKALLTKGNKLLEWIKLEYHETKAKLLIAEKNSNTQEAALLKKELDLIEVRGEEMKSMWDIFESWDLDIHDEKLAEGKEAN